jgi:oxygen-independent coproporphyrinogen-3 oxidase
MAKISVLGVRVGGGAAQSDAEPRSAQDAAELADARGGVHYEGLYVHVPFCRHKCHYCDFYSFVDSEDRSEAFVERLLAEAAAAARFIRSPLTSVFVGGGTPTMLPAPLLRRMVDGIRARLPMAPNVEWTIEANPETVDSVMAQELGALHVQRVSLGAQSFDRELLRALERHHDPASVGRAVALLRAAGVPQINLDLIFAAPGSTVEQCAADLRTALALQPDHLSAYGLVYEPNTPLTVKLRQGAVQRVSDDNEAAQYEHVIEALSADGFHRYEVSNWARSGAQCKHNLLYWRNGDWFGLGPSAASHARGVRWRNVPRLGDWLTHGPSSPAQDVEVLSEDAQVGETFMLGLRVVSGMERTLVEQLLQLGSSGFKRRAAIERHLAAGLLMRGETHLRLTARGFQLADSVLVDLL